MAHISNIKLIRTDTTLDLSQKAEKVFGNNDTGEAQKFGRIVKLKLSHFFLFFVSLFFISCMFSRHKLLFHGSEFLPYFEQNHLLCEVPLAEFVDCILEPHDYLNFARFPLCFVETETYDTPRFGGHQTLRERERDLTLQ
ncbi:unnamed protein product [Arabidopsis lyrata]|uniref:Predicted protein n=1 Tax=Arabidopsis lyrata subsp. lyrata TaxID=81972 RepID=D7LQB8_ARALL|nr:predicted protein [Arabidopsis lyrata subsp. lyrata]CAH8266567.1 unnamed protein product [Arabidopsis lyrata]